MKCSEVTSHPAPSGKCTDPDIPKYLHTVDRKVLEQSKFRLYHKIYRLESSTHPLVPDSSFNALSCNWSKLIKHNDVSRVKPTIGTDFKFCFYNSLSKFKVEQDIEDAEFGGHHVLSCFTVHEPEVCDYSHVIILIKHQIFAKDKFRPYFCEVYTYEEWSQKKCLLRKKKSRAFKELRKKYRVEMLRTFVLRACLKIFYRFELQSVKDSLAIGPIYPSLSTVCCFFVIFI